MKRGIDVSQWQGTIDWQQVRPHVDFVFLKATEGTGFVDPSFQRNRAECNRLGIPWGPYHFAQIGSDPSSQAAHLWRTAGASPLPPVLDLEPTSVPARDACADWALTFQSTLERACGRIPMLYTGAYVAFTRRPAFTRYPLWLAAYTPQPIDCPPWPTWSVWQWGSTGRIPGISGNVDMNQGKDDWLAAALGGSASTSSIPQPPEEDIMATRAELQQDLQAQADRIIAAVNAAKAPPTDDGLWMGTFQAEGKVYIVVNGVRYHVPGGATEGETNQRLELLQRQGFDNRGVQDAALSALPEAPFALTAA